MINTSLNVTFYNYLIFFRLDFQDEGPHIGRRFWHTSATPDLESTEASGRVRKQAYASPPGGSTG